jgi:hypothetical protein
MRIITKEHEAAMRKNRVYCLIVNTPRPDFAALQKDSDEFERWISKVHRKERERIAHSRMHTA